MAKCKDCQREDCKIEETTKEWINCGCWDSDCTHAIAKDLAIAECAACGWHHTPQVKVQKERFRPTPEQRRMGIFSEEDLDLDGYNEQ